MTAYRAQQLAAAALIDSGDYTADQIAEVYGWIKPKPKPPERSAPEQSGCAGLQTGDKNALTRAQKCAILVKKAVKRHVRRATKSYRRAKTMTTYTESITYSHWIEGSGWSLQDCYAGFDDTDIPSDKINPSWSAEDFAALICEGYDDDALHSMADDSLCDDKYTYLLTDDNGKEVQRIEIWASVAAQYMLGMLDDVPTIRNRKNGGAKMKAVDALFKTAEKYEAAAGVPHIDSTLVGGAYRAALDAAGITLSEHSRYAAVRYTCAECGNVVYGRYRSKYEQLPCCDVCGVSDMWTASEG